MNAIFNRALALAMTMLMVFSLAACGTKDATGSASSAATDSSAAVVSTESAAVADVDLWKDAVYTEDTELGSGKTALAFEVEADGKTVKFTVNTDEKTVGAALLKENLIAGDDSEYGLYVKTVNGIKADYDTDGAYWAFYCGKVYAEKGVDSTDIDAATTYRLVYTQG